MKTLSAKNKLRDKRAKDAEKKPTMSNNSTMSVASSRSSGRASLSSSASDCIIDLLIHHSNKPVPSSDNKKDSQRRHFIRDLITSSARKAVSTPTSAPSPTPIIALSATGAPLPSKIPISKVRINLYLGNPSGKPKSGPKTLVIPPATTHGDFLKLAKNKLSSKKKLQAVYYRDKLCTADSFMAGWKDDAKIFVDIDLPPSELPPPPPPANNEEETEPAQPPPSSLSLTKSHYTPGTPPTIPYPTIPTPPLPYPVTTLPIAPSFPSLLFSLTTSPVTIITGATGSGKSTLVPHLLHTSLPQANVLCSQPRRVAATSLAARCTTQIPSGRAVVGHNVRLSNTTLPTTRISYVTIGILHRLLLQNSLQPRNGPPYTHIIVDEVHERSLLIDSVLGMLKDYLRHTPNLRVAVMSATADVGLFRDYFVDFAPQVVEVKGTAFDVTVRYLDEAQRFVGGRMVRNGPPQPPADSSGATGGPSTDASVAMAPLYTHTIDYQFIANLVTKLHSENLNVSNGILVFLPGKNEIERLVNLLKGGAVKGEVLPLHSQLTQKQQHHIFNDSVLPKIVIATNIAETSLTIPNITHVIDVGVVKEIRYNGERRISELTTCYCSRAGWRQRSGRAGRVQDGVCWRLFDAELNTVEFSVPEIARVSVDDLVLQTTLMRDEGTGVDVNAEVGRLIQPPGAQVVDTCCSQLVEIGAMEAMEGGGANIYQLTPLGYHLSQLPMDCRVGKLLLTGCLLGCLEPALIVAACLSAPKNVMGFVNNSNREALNEVVDAGYGGRNTACFVRGDFYANVAVVEAFLVVQREPLRTNERMAWCRKRGLDFNALKEVVGLTGTFRNALIDADFVTAERTGNENSSNPLLLQCCLVGGLYPNVAVLQRPKQPNKGGRLVTRTGEVTKPHMNSFQAVRVKEAAVTGKDAYVVFNGMFRSVNKNGEGQVFLDQVNFVSRFSLLLFGGALTQEGSCVGVGSFLKFKVGGGGEEGNVIVRGLREVVESVLLARLSNNKRSEEEEEMWGRMLEVVVRLMEEEKL